jgi:hypothetical protein
MLNVRSMLQASRILMAAELGLPVFPSGRSQDPGQRLKGGEQRDPQTQAFAFGDTHLREVLGFVCRWSLFALAGAICVAVGLVSALVADAATGEVCATMTVPDAVYFQKGDPRRLVWGYLQPDIPYYAPILGVCHNQDGPLLLVEGDRKTLYPVVEAAETGVYRVTVTGMPHAAVAFQEEVAILRIVPDRREVFLIDAAMYLDAPAARQGEFRGCMAEMRRRGEPALFEVGTRQGFLAHRAKLRVLHADMPLLWAPQELGDPLATLHRAARPIKSRCVVITDQAALAAQAASAGFATELIAPADQAAAAVGGLRRHDSIAKFKEYLASQPITR